MEAQITKIRQKRGAEQGFWQSQFQIVALAGVLSMVFGHQLAKVCSGQRFWGSQGGIWSSGPARPGSPGKKTLGAY